jgi:hypothetical protein
MLLGGNGIDLDSLDHRLLVDIVMLRCCDGNDLGTVDMIYDDALG